MMRRLQKFLPIPAATILPQPNNRMPCKCDQWSISNHFENCSKFEQSLPKMMTRRQRSSRKMSTGWAAAPEPDGPSLGRSPGAQQAASSRRQDQIETTRENRVDTMFRAGPDALLFFCAGLLRCRVPQPQAPAARHAHSWQLPLAIGIGLDAVKRLNAKPRVLAVTCCDSSSSPLLRRQNFSRNHASVGQRTLAIAPEMNAKLDPRGRCGDSGGFSRSNRALRDAAGRSLKAMWPRGR